MTQIMYKTDNFLIYTTENSDVINVVKNNGRSYSVSATVKVRHGLARDQLESIVKSKKLREIVQAEINKDVTRSRYNVDARQVEFTNTIAQENKEAMIRKATERAQRSGSIQDRVAYTRLKRDYGGF